MPLTYDLDHLNLVHTVGSAIGIGLDSFSNSKYYITYSLVQLLYFFFFFYGATARCRALASRSIPVHSCLSIAILLQFLSPISCLTSLSTTSIHPSILWSTHCSSTTKFSLHHFKWCPFLVHVSFVPSPL